MSTASICLLIKRTVCQSAISRRRIKWNFVRGSWWWWWWSFFMCLQYCSTDLLYMCRCAVNKTPGRPRAQEGTRTTGNTRALTHGHLKAVHWGAKNKHLRLRSKHIAPNPRIARAPELVQKILTTDNYSISRRLRLTSSEYRILTTT